MGGWVHAWRSEDNLSNQFSPFLWVWGIKLRASGLNKYSYSLNHLRGSVRVCFKVHPLYCIKIINAYKYIFTND